MKLEFTRVVIGLGVIISVFGQQRIARAENLYTLNTNSNAGSSFFGTHEDLGQSFTTPPFSLVTYYYLKSLDFGISSAGSAYRPALFELSGTTHVVGAPIWEGPVIPAGGTPTTHFDTGYVGITPAHTYLAVLEQFGPGNLSVYANNQPLPGDNHSGDLFTQNPGTYPYTDLTWNRVGFTNLNVTDMQLTAVLSDVPEPTAAAAGALLATTLLRRRRSTESVSR